MRRMVLVIAAMFVVLALYSFSGTSDQLDPLTDDQRAEIMARQGE